VGSVPPPPPEETLLPLELLFFLKLLTSEISRGENFIIERRIDRRSSLLLSEMGHSFKNARRVP
jgi:hypothetical protein